MSLLDDTITPVKDKSIEVLYALEEVANEFRNYFDVLEYDEHTLNKIERRLEIINNLKRKYENSIEAILERQYEMKLAVEQVENKDAYLKHYEKEKEAALNEYDEVSEKLSLGRRESALKVEALIKENLENLGIYQKMVKKKLNFILVQIKEKGHNL